MPGAPRGDNPVPTTESKTTIASRGTSPRDAFRVSTTEDENLLMQAAIDEDIAKRQAQGDSCGANGLASSPSGTLLELSAQPDGSQANGKLSGPPNGADTGPSLPIITPTYGATVGSSDSATAAAILSSE